MRPQGLRRRQQRAQHPGLTDAAQLKVAQAAQRSKHLQSIRKQQHSQHSSVRCITPGHPAAATSISRRQLFCRPLLLPMAITPTADPGADAGCLDPSAHGGSTLAQGTAGQAGRLPAHQPFTTSGTKHRGSSTLSHPQLPMRTCIVHKYLPTPARLPPCSTYCEALAPHRITYSTHPTQHPRLCQTAACSSQHDRHPPVVPTQESSPPPHLQACAHSAG